MQITDCKYMRITEVITCALRGRTPIKSTRRKILLAGTKYNIKIEQSSKNCSKIEGQTLVVGLKEMTRENLNHYLDSWYRREARKLFKSSLFYWQEEMERMGYYLPEDIRIKIYKMRKAWGRCYYTKGVITLNLYLACTPKECIDCIVLHELCHFLISSHSSDFYGIMSRINPSWRKSEMLLKDFATKYAVIRFN